jgi:hypothetical protein
MLVWMRQRASHGGAAVGVGDGRAVGVEDAATEGAAENDGVADVAVVTAGDAVVAPVEQPAKRTARRALRSARWAIS